MGFNSRAGNYPSESSPTLSVISSGVKASDGARDIQQGEALAALAPELTDARTPSLDRVGIFVAFATLLEALATERLFG